jgi:hypothetical protein
MNIVAYIHRRYIPRLLRWLTGEYKQCSSVIELCSLVITKERVLVPYSVHKVELHQGKPS